MDDIDDLGSRELRPVDVINCYRLWMIWTILCHEIKLLDAINYFRQWKTWTTQGRELEALDATNKPGLWMTWTIPGHGIRPLDFIYSSSLWFTSKNRSYELRALNAMNKIGMSWARGFGCYELLRVVDGMNELRSRKLKPLGAMNISWLWMIWMILGHEHKALNVMNN